MEDIIEQQQTIEDTNEVIEYGDLYLKFPDEATALEVLEDYEGAVDVIGVISKPTGEMTFDDEGNEVPVMTTLEGWHVNTRGSMPLDLQAFAVQVDSPYRVWA
jgi:hypothetical protein